MTPFDGPVVPEEQMIAAGRVFALLMRGALNERAIINLFKKGLGQFTYTKCFSPV